MTTVPTPQHAAEQASIEQLCADVYEPLVAVLTTKLGNRLVAEDIAQDALAKAWQRWPEVSGKDRPDLWVFRVGLNMAGSWVRRLGAERRAAARLKELPPKPDLVEILVLREALRTLSSRQRQVIALRFYGELSVDETAEVLGIAAGTVKALTSRAKEKLRTALAETADDADDKGER